MLLTCDRREVYADKQSEEAGDVGQDIAVSASCGTIWIQV